MAQLPRSGRTRSAKSSATASFGHYIGRFLTLMLIVGMAGVLYTSMRPAFAETGPAGSTPTTQDEKRTVPTPTKQVRTGSTASNNAWGNHVVAGVGDVVSYRLQSSLPNDLASYKSYELWFSDELGDGQSYLKDSVRSYVMHKDKTTTDIKLSATFADKSMRIGSDDILGLVPTLTSTDVIVVEYDCKVLPQAVGGLTEGNPNTVTLRYTNPLPGYITPMPHYVTPHPGRTPVGSSITQTVTVHALGITIRKVDATSGAPLAGASFIIQNNQGQYRTSSGSWTSNQAEALVVTTDQQGTARFSGISDGTFTITETKVPDGYVGAQGPIRVTLVASNMDSSQRTLSATVEGANATLTSVEARDGIAVVEVKNTKATTAGSAVPTNTSASADGSTAPVATTPANVVIQAINSVLPTTGDKLVALSGSILVISVGAIVMGMALRRSHDE